MNETHIQPDPDRMVTDFVEGRMSRRSLIAHLMAMGAAAAGVGGMAGGIAHGVARNDDAPAGGNDAGEPTFTAKGLDHIALNVTDIERSSEWYMKHLGLEPMSMGRTSVFLRCRDSHDFLALFRSDTPGMHHYSYAIESYDQQEAAERLRAAGLTPKLRGRRIYFDDPDGIEVQVSQQR
jgi:catechol 2,3-dioxygenase-like lactoylglutathione lyase family enzyme